MKTFILPLVLFLTIGLTLSAQDSTNKTAGQAPTAQEVLTDASLNSIPTDCPGEPCPCLGRYTSVDVYYFGPDNSTVRVYQNAALTPPVIQTFFGVNNGDLLTITDPGSPTLGGYTFLQVTEAGGTVCTVKLFTQCPTEAWPGASSDNAILGKTFGHFFVYSVTDQGNSFTCDLTNIEQDWHVGGNVVDGTNNQLGTRNNESVVLITNDTPRGIITATGDFGLGNNAPGARLEVTGNSILDGTLDVSGITRINDISASNSPLNGALIVSGGTGIGGSVNVAGNGSIAGDFSVGGNSDFTGTVDVGGLLTVNNDAHITGNVGIGTIPGAAKLHIVGNDWLLESGSQNLHATVSPNNQLLSNGDNFRIRSTNGNHIYMNSGVNDGKVAIGTTQTPTSLNAGAIDISNYRLFVRGGILADEVRVRTTWADYVFLPEYKLLSLQEVDSFIAQNGHLPNMPSAETIENGGLSVGEATTLQQEKIEEIFLHLIELKKQVEDLKRENKELKDQISKS